MREKVKVSKKLLEDQDVKECLLDPIASQLYLAIGQTHLRSQYFTEAVKAVAAALKKRDVRKMTAEQFSDILRNFGQADGAVREPWAFTPARVWPSDCHPPGATPKWRSINKRRRQEIEANERGARERLDKLDDLLEAIEGTNRWEIEWID